MSTVSFGRRGRSDDDAGGQGDRVMFAVCAAAGVVAGIVLITIVIELLSGAHQSFSKFGLAFLGHQDWEPNAGFLKFGAATALYGTFITSAFALIIATPLAIGIALYLALMAPPAVRAIVGPLVEMIAAVPSVIIGLWGLIVLAPFLQRHIETPLHDVLGWIPLFGTPQTTGLSLFTASLILALMILPIVASLSRDLFLTVPRELMDGAAALGSTRWEVIRGVVLPTTFSGVAASVVLALGRALGEAIAVTQVVGDAAGINGNIFQSGQTLASRIANDYSGISSNLQKSSIYYLAVILLLFAAASNTLANFISTRYAVKTS